MLSTFKELLAKYGQAWEEQDTALILSIFTDDASYFDPFYDEPAQGVEGIRNYWDNKVCKDQANIKFNLLHAWVDGNTGIAEWEAEFDDIVKGVRKYIKEVAIFELKDGKFSDLREYYKSKALYDL